MASERTPHETPDDNEQVRHDTSYSPGSDSDTEALQGDVADSPAIDPDDRPSGVEVLPGTGGPDDVGDVRPVPQEQPD